MNVKRSSIDWTNSRFFCFYHELLYPMIKIEVNINSIASGIKNAIQTIKTVRMAFLLFPLIAGEKIIYVSKDK